MLILKQDYSSEISAFQKMIISTDTTQDTNELRISTITITEKKTVKINNSGFYNGVRKIPIIPRSASETDATITPFEEEKRKTY